MADWSGRQGISSATAAHRMGVSFELFDRGSFNREHIASVVGAGARYAGDSTARAANAAFARAVESMSDEEALAVHLTERDWIRAARSQGLVGARGPLFRRTGALKNPSTRALRDGSGAALPWVLGEHPGGNAFLFTTSRFFVIDIDGERSAAQMRAILRAVGGAFGLDLVGALIDRTAHGCHVPVAVDAETTVQDGGPGPQEAAYLSLLTHRNSDGHNSRSVVAGVMLRRVLADAGLPSQWADSIDIKAGDNVSGVRAPGHIAVDASGAVSAVVSDAYHPDPINPAPGRRGIAVMGAEQQEQAGALLRVAALSPELRSLTSKDMDIVDRAGLLAAIDEARALAGTAPLAPSRKKGPDGGADVEWGASAEAARFLAYEGSNNPLLWGEWADSLGLAEKRAVLRTKYGDGAVADADRAMSSTGVPAPPSMARVIKEEREEHDSASSATAGPVLSAAAVEAMGAGYPLDPRDTVNVKAAARAMRGLLARKTAAGEPLPKMRNRRAVVAGFAWAAASIDSLVEVLRAVGIDRDTSSGRRLGEGALRRQLLHWKAVWLSDNGAPSGADVRAGALLCAPIDASGGVEDGLRPLSAALSLHGAHSSPVVSARAGELPKRIRAAMARLREETVFDDVNGLGDLTKWMRRSVWAAYHRVARSMYGEATPELSDRERGRLLLVGKDPKTGGPAHMVALADIPDRAAAVLRAAGVLDQRAMRARDAALDERARAVTGESGLILGRVNLAAVRTLDAAARVAAEPAPESWTVLTHDDPRLIDTEAVMDAVLAHPETRKTERALAGTAALLVFFSMMAAHGHWSAMPHTLAGLGGRLLAGAGEDSGAAVFAMRWGGENLRKIALVRTVSHPCPGRGSVHALTEGHGFDIACKPRSVEGALRCASFCPSASALSGAVSFEWDEETREWALSGATSTVPLPMSVAAASAGAGKADRDALDEWGRGLRSLSLMVSRAYEGADPVGACVGLVASHTKHEDNITGLVVRSLAAPGAVEVEAGYRAEFGAPGVWERDAPGGEPRRALNRRVWERSGAGLARILSSAERRDGNEQVFIPVVLRVVDAGLARAVNPLFRSARPLVDSDGEVFDGLLFRVRLEDVLPARFASWDAAPWKRGALAAMAVTVMREERTLDVVRVRERVARAVEARKAVGDAVAHVSKCPGGGCRCAGLHRLVGALWSRYSRSGEARAVVAASAIRSARSEHVAARMRERGLHVVNGRTTGSTGVDDDSGSSGQRAGGAPPLSAVPHAMEPPGVGVPGTGRRRVPFSSAWAEQRILDRVSRMSALEEAFALAMAHPSRKDPESWAGGDGALAGALAFEQSKRLRGALTGHYDPSDALEPFTLLSFDYVSAVNATVALAS